MHLVSRSASAVALLLLVGASGAHASNADFNALPPAEQLAALEKAKATYDEECTKKKGANLPACQRGEDDRDFYDREVTALAKQGVTAPNNTERAQAVGWAMAKAAMGL